METSTRQHRLTLALRQDLAERVHRIAALLGQNPNHFVNQCVEGCLNAMDAEGIAADIPIITLVRKICGRPVLEAKCVPAICALFAPRSMKLTPRHFQQFADLINRHEGKLTSEGVRLYWKLADDRCQQQTKFDRELAVLNESSVPAKES